MPHKITFASSSRILYKHPCAKYQSGWGAAGRVGVYFLEIETIEHVVFQGKSVEFTYDAETDRLIVSTQCTKQRLAEIVEQVARRKAPIKLIGSVE